MHYLSSMCTSPVLVQGREKAICVLEYQVMPSLRDVAHDGVLYIFINRSSGQVWSVRAGGMDRPSRTKSHPAGSLSSS
jgi:hypothetical protein